MIIIHQTHYEKSDWSRAFNQFTIACELDMINVISEVKSDHICTAVIHEVKRVKNYCDDHSSFRI